ncbi:MAG: hypothetical protein HY840_16170 [Bacteroidetes bacterium]|nr:hypothetical protein [Bacteroidota bacterium]
MKTKLTLFSLVLMIALTSYSQETQIKGFANIDAMGSFEKDTARKDENHFAIGQYDLFITSQITQNVKMLGESVFEFDGNSFAIDLERVMVDYYMKDYFSISVGKFHTPLGYWNNAYHHGMALQPTSIRPDALKFEDEGGILPIHELGAQLHGDGITKYNFGYNLMLSNGIAADAAYDYNKSKAVTANLHAEPIENLKLYVSGYMDRVPDGYTTAQGITVKKTDVQILNASIAYVNGKFPIEFIGEFFNVTTNMDSVVSKVTNGYVLYAGYKIKKFVPYVSYDGIAYQKGEQYFIENNVQTTTLGLRYIMSPLSVLKLEYKYHTSAQAGMPSVFRNQITLQFAFGF